ncbi:hypothetical protein Salmuc_02398 [Salipiger mucosus DSM 16094]|uniref:HdeD family acid-resistance protein n=1 Tax=Salipiger mucosus DSM 16094 TaxID=1123237 RepID=S9QQX4_9RHOB|nr:hypothetical protein Salmuc_02398 [Salipiger mucosus DSM 16094]
MPSDLQRAIKQNAKTFQWMGVALIVIGLLAIVFPLFASIAIKVLLGWLFLVSGAVLLWYAFQARSWTPAVLTGLIGVLYLAGGVYLSFFPTTGLVGLTVLMAIVFVAQGIFELAMSWQHRPGHGNAGPGWAWAGLSGVVSLVLGVLLLAGLPGTALWALGLFLGINLLTSGISFVALARTAGRL